MARRNGNTVAGVWRCFTEESVSSSNTQTTIVLECNMESIAWGIDIHNIYAEANINGNVKSTSTASFYSGTGQTVQKNLVRHSVTYNRTTYAQNKTLTAKIVNSTGYKNGTSTCSFTVTVPALASYKVSYNANGGSGAPSAQTKWYGTTLKLSSTKPTRTGYTFQGWATSSGGSVAYASGASYTANASVTLYAVWKANTWTISYNANGGSGAPGAQTKTYGVTLKLSSTRPTRTNYNFLGWATSSTATSAQYQPGGSFTTNATTTLYAVWQLAYVKPRITNLNADRCNSAGTLSEEGTYAKVTFSWATDRTVSSVKIVCNGVTTTVSGQSGTSGSVSVVVGSGALSTENSYSVAATVADSGGSTTGTTSVAPMEYIMDIEPGGSMAFGGPARSFGSGLETVEFYNGIVHHKPPMVSIEASSSGYGSAGYNKILTLTNGAGATYSNSSIEITFVQRGRHVCTVNLYASNANSQAITVGSASGIAPSTAFGDDSVYYRQPTSNVIELWVKKTEAYDIIKVVNVYYDRYYMSKLEMDTTQSHSASLPSGCVAIGIRSLLGLPYAQVGGYYGMTLADGSSTEWMRTTGNGLIPYKAGTPSVSSLGTSTWQFKSGYIDQLYSDGLTWTGNGLKGRVMKQLWAGTWTSGSLTLSELPRYNLFMFGLGNDQTQDWWVVAGANPNRGTTSVTMYVTFWGYNVAGQHLYNPFKLVIAGTKITINQRYGNGLFNDDLVHGSTQSSRIHRIYGIL